MALAERGITQKTKYSPETINQELIKGRTREDLAKEFGHKDFKAIDMYMRRNGYKWDRDKQMYVSKEKKNFEVEEKTKAGPQKLTQALKLFEEGKEPKQVAKELGFSSHHALADYMKEKGYVWNPKTFQYEPVNGEEAPEEAEKQETNNGYTEQEILEVVMNNKDKLAEMLEMSEPETLPRYMVSGYKINKCIQLSHRLDAILKDFCQENNISQREIIEIGIIETLRKHGYQAEIKGLLGS